MTDRLTIKFVGICAFVKKTGGKILAVLPEAGTLSDPGEVKGLNPHRAFIRWERKDIDGASSLQADDGESDPTYGVVVLKDGANVTIDGPVKSTVLDVKRSFIDQIPEMEKHTTSPAQTSRKIAASVPLERGDLEAEPAERGHWWVFKRYRDTTVSKAEEKDAQEFSNVVLWKLEVDSASKEPIRIAVCGKSLVIPASATGTVEVTIGNLEGSLLPVDDKKTNLPPQDVDFLYHYEIAEVPPPAVQRPIPTRVTQGGKGGHVLCLAARWGGIKEGIQS